MKTIKKLAYLLIAIVGLVLYLGLKELNKESRKEKIDKITDQVFENTQKLPDYKEHQIGTSSFKIKSPYPLISSNLSIPEAYKDRIEKMEVLEFEENPFFKGKLTYYKWINGVSYDLNAGLDGALDNIRKLPGVEKVMDDRKYFENSKIQSYFFEAIMLRYQKSAVLKGAILKSGQEALLIMFEPVDSEKESIIIDILESLKEPI